MSELKTYDIRMISHATQADKRDGIARDMISTREKIRELNHTPLFGLHAQEANAAYMRENKLVVARGTVQNELTDLGVEQQKLANKLRKALRLPDALTITQQKLSVQRAEDAYRRATVDTQQLEMRIHTTRSLILEQKIRLEELRQESDRMRAQLEVESADFGPNSVTIRKLFKDKHPLWNGLAPDDLALLYLRLKDPQLADMVLQRFQLGGVEGVASGTAHSLEDYIIDRYIKHGLESPIPVQIDYTRSSNMRMLPKKSRRDILYGKNSDRDHLPHEWDNAGQHDNCFWHISRGVAGIVDILASHALKSHRAAIEDGGTVAFNTNSARLQLSRGGIQSGNQHMPWSEIARADSYKFNKRVTQEFDQIYFSRGGTYIHADAALVFSERELLRDFQLGDYSDGYPLFDLRYDSDQIDAESKAKGWPPGIHGARVSFNAYHFAVAVNADQVDSLLGLIRTDFDKMPNPNKLTYEEWTAKHIIVVKDINRTYGESEVKTTFYLRNTDIPTYTNSVVPTGNIGDTAVGGTICNLYRVKVNE